jgi:hypothetical protein
MSLYKDYKNNNNSWAIAMDSLISMIENETEFLFENPKKQND